MNMNEIWNSVDGLDSVASPGLLLDVDRAEQNIHSMLRVVGGDVTRLRPHVKTHKMPNIIQMQMGAGISKFKAATIAEAKMVAQAGATDVLVAYPVVGHNVDRLSKLISEHSNTSFSVLADDPIGVNALADSHRSLESPLRVFIDVDCGMHRTGIAWGDALVHLQKAIEARSELAFAGLHVYDGHLHQPDLSQRKQATCETIAEVQRYVAEHGAPEVVAGGSPTFAIWASESEYVCSPGTTVFWDIGYASNFPDLPFEIAAALITRVVSKPGGQRICVDLGYKSIAAEMPLDRRVHLPAIDEIQWIGQSEEHLVFETPAAESLSIGEPLLAFPRHICPTVALHDWANIIRDSQITGERWPVTARSR